MRRAAEVFAPPAVFSDDLPDLDNTLLAVVDVGGNSVSLELRRASRPLQKDEDLPPKYNAFCGLAGSIGKNGKMSDKAMEAALEALTKIAKIIEGQQQTGQAVVVKAIGTAPFRNASNGDRFANRIRETTGLPLRILRGDEEARYAARGVLEHFPGISGVVADTGGGSTELAVIKNGEIVATHSLPLGMLRIACAKNARDFIESQLDALPDEFHGHGTLIITGGTNRALCKAFARSEDLTIARGAGKILTAGPGKLTKFAHDLARQDTEALVKRFGVKAERARQIEPAAMLLEALCKRLDVRSIVLNKATIRDGIRADMIGTLKGETAEPARTRAARIMRMAEQPALLA